MLEVFVPTEVCSRGRLIAFAWPDAIHVDGGLIAGARLAWSAATDEARAPDWLVFGALARAVAADGEPSFRVLHPGQLVEKGAPNLMAVRDAWQANGFAMAAKSHLTRLTHETESSPTIDDNGDLLPLRLGQQEPDRPSLAKPITEPTWLDQATGGRYR
jgi:hypothetical protein